MRHRSASLEISESSNRRVAVGKIQSLQKGRMFMRQITRLFSTLALALVLGAPAFGQPFFFTTGDPDGRIGVATHRASDDGSKIEVEAADDFILSKQTLIYGAIFTGLMPPNFTLDDIGTIEVEIYRRFPNDSDTTRTTNVPP